MRKIAIFSDIHSNLEALEAIICDIKKQVIEEVICLGDVISIGPSPSECLDLIIKNNIKLILGNHELYYIYGTDIDDEMSNEEVEHQKWVASKLNNKHMEFLKQCKLKYGLDIYNKSFCFQHFLLDENSKDDYPFYTLRLLGSNDLNIVLKHTGYDYLFFGHEHQGFEIDLKSQKFIDVGSSGCVKDDMTFYTILSLDDNYVDIEKVNIPYNRDKFIKTIISINYPLRDHVAKMLFGINI